MLKKIVERWEVSLEEAKKYVVGCDIDKDAVKIAKQYISQVYVADALMGEWDTDIVITNPPYIRIQNLNDNARKQLNKFEYCNGDTDIYMAFFEKLINFNGISGYICPNSWIKNKNAGLLRKRFLADQRAVVLIDFKDKKVFNGVGTYTSIVINSDNKVSNIKVGNELNEVESIEWNKFNFLTKKDSAFAEEVVQRSTSIFDICKITTGFATLADKVFFMEEGSGLELLIPCVKGSNITKNKGKKYEIIYPYDSDGRLIDESVLRTEFPNTYNHLKNNEEILFGRDKGKCKARWYEYGRSQGIPLIKKDKIIFAPMIKNKMHFTETDGAFLSGYAIIPYFGYSLKFIRTIFQSEDVQKWVSIFGKDFGNGWKGVSKETFRYYRINIKI
jgi:adenine-specific DNA-methyltransferase